MPDKIEDNLAELVFSLMSSKGLVWIVGKKNKMRVIAKVKNTNIYVYQVVTNKGEKLLYQGSEESRVRELLEK